MQFPFGERRETRAAFSVCSSNHRHRGTRPESVIFGVYHYGDEQKQHRVIKRGWLLCLHICECLPYEEVHLKEHGPFPLFV